GFMWLAEVADVLRTRLGVKVPTRRLPDLAVRVVSLFDKELRQVVPELGVRTVHQTTAAATTLGWKPRPLADTIVDCARSLGA
ncbi:hypothetical protein ACFQ1S_45980, partial [Kibdelosporangium lantanae]